MILHLFQLVPCIAWPISSSTISHHLDWGQGPWAHWSLLPHRRPITCHLWWILWWHWWREVIKGIFMAITSHLVIHGYNEALWTLMWTRGCPASTKRRQRKQSTLGWKITQVLWWKWPSHEQFWEDLAHCCLWGMFFFHVSILSNLNFGIRKLESDNGYCTKITRVLLLFWKRMERRAPENPSIEHSLFLFMRPRVEIGNLIIEHCLTDEMIGDFYTKPLQGKKFCMFRDSILGSWIIWD